MEKIILNILEYFKNKVKIISIILTLFILSLLFILVALIPNTYQYFLILLTILAIFPLILKKKKLISLYVTWIVFMGTIDQYQYTDFVKKVVFGFGLLIIILTPILVTFGKQMYLSSKNIFTDKNNRKAYCFAILFASFIVFSFFLMELFYLFGFWNFPEVIFKNANFAMFLTFMGPSLILFYNTAYSCYKIKTDTTDVLKTDGLNEAVKAISNSIFGFFSFSSCLLILAKIFVPNLNSETYKYRFISLPIVIFCEIFLIIIFYKLLTNLSQLDRKNNN